MLKQTRRRALGLLIAAGLGAHILPAGSRAFAQDETGNDAEDDADETECFDTKTFGSWMGQASDTRAGASQSEVPLLDLEACALAMQLQVNTDFEARVFVTGDAEEMPLPETLLVKPESRFIAKLADGTTSVDEALCGNCTDIYDDTVSLVLPLATAPLFREQDTVELALRFAGRDEDCRFAVDCVTMRQALDWAAARRDELATERDNGACEAPDGCFITTACCEVLGLDDECFELRTLRRYRDEVLARRPDGASAIASYYALAPRILAGLSASSCDRDRTLLSVYARYVLPSAIAAKFGLNALAHGLYARMLNELMQVVSAERIDI